MDCKSPSKTNALFRIFLALQLRLLHVQLDKLQVHHYLMYYNTAVCKSANFASNENLKTLA